MSITFESLLNPNLAYLLLVASFWLIMMSIFSPGTGVFEVGTVISLVLAGWQVYSLPFNWWALVILIVGVVPFLIAVRRSGKLIYLVVSILALVIGSTFFFRGESWNDGVNPILAGVVSVMTAGFMWLVTVKTIEAQEAVPSHDLTKIIGSTGITRTLVFDEGAVLVKMEEWSARSNTPIQPGEKVRIVDRDGFVLVVEPLGDNH